MTIRSKREKKKTWEWKNMILGNMVKMQLMTKNKKKKKSAKQHNCAFSRSLQMYGYIVDQRSPKSYRMVNYRKDKNRCTKMRCDKLWQYSFVLVTQSGKLGRKTACPNVPV